MKKLIFASLLGIFTILPLTARAEEPIFGFMDGKFYDSSQTLKYLCFLDNKCYDLMGKFAFNRQLPKGVVAGAHTFFNLLTVPNQWFPREVNDGVITEDMVKISCTTENLNDATQLTCKNGSNLPIYIKAISFTLGVKYDDDYASIKQFHIFNNSNVDITPTFDSSNTAFSNLYTANIIYTLPNPVELAKTNLLTKQSASYSLKSLGNGYPNLVLVGIDGHDVIYKVNLSQ